jgi:hypothetical protein
LDDGREIGDQLETDKPREEEKRKKKETYIA